MARNVSGTAEPGQTTDHILDTNHRATGRVEETLRHLASAEATATRVLTLRTVPGPATGRARDRLSHALVELREAVDVASGEWWQPALPPGRVAAAEQQGHHTLSLLVRATAPGAPAA